MNTLFLKMLVKAQDLMNREEGQDLVEYALLVAVVAIGMVAAVTAFKAIITSAWATISANLSS